MGHLQDEEGCQLYSQGTEFYIARVSMLFKLLKDLFS